MRNSVLFIFVLLSFVAEGRSEVAEIVAGLHSHCSKCHGDDGKVEGDINLLELKTAEHFENIPALLESVVRVLQDREMPPNDSPTLSDEQRQALIGQLKEILNRTIRDSPFKRTPIRRMNRFQYNNAVVDLLDLERDIFQLNERLMRRREDYFRPESGKMPDHVRVSCRPLSKDIDSQRPEGFRGVAAFPQDQRAEHGFDNRADHLSLSPLLMQSFFELSQSVSQSPDLNEKECGSWEAYFANPDATDKVSREVELRSRISSLLRRAFRRPAEQEVLNRITGFAVKKIDGGSTFEQTMCAVLGVVLGMPDFLYIHESHDDSTPNPGREPVTDFELATRLSQFLWSSIPDDELLDMAESKKLRDADTLSAQIDRMLNDRRSARFCENFPGQWLQLDRLVTAIPDREQYPWFYYNGYRSSMHMMSEPLLLFETVFVENRSVMDLLDPDFTWQSPMLAANYKGNSQADLQVQVQTFRRVPLDDPRRGGVITNAAVMTMTSTPTRTQPITRGAWVNAVIFNDPPEPPPADVPPLSEKSAGELDKLTIRERLAEHRKRADCAGCHNRLDPLGFALENYGPTGVWRDKYENGRNVDCSGELFGQHKFTTAVEFKRLIVKEKPRFVKAFAAHLLTYALGRELGPADSPTLDEITARATGGDDSLRAIMKAVATSESFLHKSNVVVE